MRLKMSMIVAIKDWTKVQKFVLDKINVNRTNFNVWITSAFQSTFIVILTMIVEILVTNPAHATTIFAPKIISDVKIPKVVLHMPNYVIMWMIARMGPMKILQFVTIWNTTRTQHCLGLPAKPRISSDVPMELVYHSKLYVMVKTNVETSLMKHLAMSMNVKIRTLVLIFVVTNL